ncbi:MAG TPA: universal stress protein [Polyangiaceae bacterium]|jgi:nucleotide-binding universal stress UspA family protein|nr:universal stress protein [Polyangiaceae bacterium]
MKTNPYVVLVGMDFSDLADRALRQAFELATLHEHAEVHIVSVVPGPSLVNYHVPPYAAANAAGTLDGAVERLRAHVQAEFEAFSLLGKKKGQQNGSLSVVSHARVDAPAKGILQLASDIGADLIVVGTHGRVGIARALVGSVAESAVRHARCPVLVIPPKDSVSDVKIEPPCSECVRARTASGGEEFWCEQHRERHTRRHTYHQCDRVGSETNLPLVFK